MKPKCGHAPWLTVLICGGRTLDPELVQDGARSILSLYGLWEITDVIVTGMAKGADEGGRLLAESAPHLKHHGYFADWKRHGKAAGPIRNQQMLDCEHPDIVLAVWDGKSRGTLDIIRRSAEFGCRIIIEPAGEYE